MVVMQCRFCQRSFSKGEHLRRHERSHTGSRPFECSFCKRPFGRQDSLIRHERLHTRSGHSKSVTTPTSSTAHPRTPESLQSLDPHEHSSINTLNSQPSGPSEPAHAVSGSGPSISDDQLPTTAPFDLSFDLIWPDSEDLFQSIISDNGTSNQWHSTFGNVALQSDFSPTAALSVGTPSSFDDRPPSIRDIPSGGNHQAVHDVSSMIASLSSSVAAAVASTPITSVFLDECLHMFFVRFVPVFPILHRATFVFREYSQALLLNAIAIGSLYLGPKSAVAKGEVLWRLAHTAVATSWQTLITHRGPYDACQGIQLLVTALLGQVYGLLSRNRTIRTSSRAFHALAFYWANHCGMSDCEPYSLANLPQMSAPQAEKDQQWRRWAAREIQQRALLAHYTIDGLIAQMSGESTSVRHSANQLGLPSSDAVFAAETADDWLNLMRTENHYETSFRSIFRLLFSPSEDSRWLGYEFSTFSFRVLLEGFQSLISDCDEDGEGAIGIPTKSEIRKALVRIYDSIMQNISIPSSERLEILLRWHSICLDAVISSSLLCRYICNRYNIEQHLWPNHGKSLRPEPDIIKWANTPDARKALLHAAAIQDIVEQLPRGRAHAIHMPSSLFAAATIYSAFALAGISTVKLPSIVDWKDALCTFDDPCLALAELSGTPVIQSDTLRYIRSESNNNSSMEQQQPYASLMGQYGAGTTTTRNLLYEFNSMQKLFRCLSTQWGVAFDMELVVDKWNSVCH